jgi:hypothetical protein
MISIFSRYTNYGEEKRPMIPIICRLEDLIKMAQEEKKVEGDVVLHKVPVTLKTHPEAGITEDQEAFLLNAAYRFHVEGMTYSVSKNYVTALPTASVDVARSNRAIANDRLKTDYKRLSTAGISVEEKYFE